MELLKVSRLNLSRSLSAIEAVITLVDDIIIVLKQPFIPGCCAGPPASSGAPPCLPDRTAPSSSLAVWK